MFSLAARATPTWKTMGGRLAGSHEEFVASAAAWKAQAEQVTGRMGLIQAELGLEDQRKSF